MVKKCIIMLVSYIFLHGNCFASEQKKQKVQNYHNQHVKKIPDSSCMETLHPIKIATGPVTKIYEDGTRETDFNNGSGAFLVENGQGFYYYIHTEDMKESKR
ncbi:hypothetical protein [Candidatus Chromulinivorax destructor]|uniref:Uncharacterized protein n=1 Tax=Candidatus Chromulinivorax destructor TaxID=2066483 RepID=A0A345ZA37_9BACT|nr:hypothetical protein [Candidatus Chromulinivorax destructor]AXK60154.1 hypothetical protein C0J27_00110 [Candidatus Chromulinivorax destructor]